MPDVLFIDLPGTPDPSLPALPISRTSVASDGFSGATLADINGRALDNKLGGSQLVTWSASPANVFAKTQQLIRGTDTTSTGYVGFTHVVNGRVSFTVPALPSANIYFDFRKNVHETSATARTSLRLRVTPTGVISLFKRVSGTQTELTALGSYTIAAGAVVTVDWLDTAVFAYAGTTLAVGGTITDVPSSTGYVLSEFVQAAATGFAVDNVKIYSY